MSSLLSSKSAKAPAAKPSVPTSSSTSPLPPPTTHPSSRSPASITYLDEKSDHIAIDIKDASSPEDQSPPDALHIFHTALGIPLPKPPKPVKPTKKNPNPPPPEKKPKLTPANKGVYNQVVDCERWAKYKYYACDCIVVGAMFLQIIVGASVTAFGAGSASHILITAFGAANTALASLLAVLKTQGLPNRIRQDWNGWRELREYIEEKEREIEMVVSGRVPGKVEELDVWGVVRAIEARYNAVRLTSEANRPDTYIKVPVPALPGR